ncbi:30S ribosomal protein S12 methylthiotransferase RimO [Clostridium felsineum]|uniref:Ribosomal protein uS12 methylthiotransferase RimO n=1 Tax=Clostridium felsineum TaxID=36839 RepID=A0A1S8MBB3_9CLOT|nr:30S ribosomal protein S12 methylthiotransferase RimO [Clostridium felsineum]MCR3758559.1 30S ribosomal protein S12 methylthiotransferase RimO [Clostridium felsineum]URZ00702.1 Ribosomal protein S12 methylthiotransferase RimO [Clostridium felsineum]URZ06659.1 Ribosomal protein S12 methylthiotransferase RimO [Clostridium felsineum]URZ11692.1 Ribosomal protein S12 methylthiotransferase RimO [Clostridium felsineum]
MNKLKFGLVSLGCDKNRVDSEIILGSINRAYEIVNDPREADIILVNTCGFIESAKQESINTILEMNKYKEKYNCKMLIATGCLTQRYGKELKELVPEIDVILGVNDYKNLDDAIDDFFNLGKKDVYLNYSDSSINEGKRMKTTGEFSSYIRIAEGCNNSCSYCIIPKIRGKYRSREFEKIIEEAKELSQNGTKELILIAQDTTRYGIDLYGKKRLHELLNSLSLIDGIEWIRIMYCYPEEITDELIEEISRNPKVCNYIDMPIQHISDNILKNMFRKTRKKEILHKIEEIREKMPDISIRTSLIVGFPGETEENFDELKDFVKTAHINNLGVFKYSREEDTKAALMPMQIDEAVKEKREDEIMIIQQQVSKELNTKKVGKTYKVLVEGFNGDYWYGRNFEMAPDIDGKVFFKSQSDVKVGSFVNIKITENLEYDLIGVVYNEFSK